MLISGSLLGLSQSITGRYCAIPFNGQEITGSRLWHCCNEEPDSQQLVPIAAQEEAAAAPGSPGSRSVASAPSSMFDIVQGDDSGEEYLRKWTNMTCGTGAD